MNIRSAFIGICALLAVLAAPAVDAAGWKPSGPITLTIGFGPGGSTDTMGRLIAKHMEKSKGWTVVVKNKGGAASVKQVLGGHVAAGFDGGRHMKYLKSGDLKVLGTMSVNRHPIAKKQKTLKEQGYPYPVEPVWFAAAPAGLPANVKAALAKAFDEAVHSADVRKIVEKRFRLKISNLGPDGATKLFKAGFKDLRGLIEAAK